MKVSRRIVALDGLRGAAAAIVVVHHLMLTVPGMPLTPQDNWNRHYSWIIVSPLHSLWDGPSAVLVFFVLSGFVLWRPHASPSYWRAYYPSRVIRLYLPVSAAVAFAAVLVATRHVNPFGFQTTWVSNHSDSFSAAELLKNATLLAGTTNLNSPLWSLRWEVIFSLLLPFYLILTRVATRGRFSVWLAVGLSLGLSSLCAAFVSTTEGPMSLAAEAGTYLPVFFLGSVVAGNADNIRLRVERLPIVWYLVILTGSLSMMSAQWWLPLSFTGGMLGAGICHLLALLSACALVCLVIGDGLMNRLCSAPMLVGLGVVSFSLYLVHEPIIVWFAKTASLPFPWQVGFSLVAVALISWLFMRVVEKPAHRMAASVRRVMS